MTGRAATASALYAAFLALWALAVAVLRRDPGPYLLLSMAVLELTLVFGALLGIARLSQVEDEVVVHAGYLLASVTILPLGWLFARGEDRRLDPATLMVALLALAIVIIRVDATTA